MITTEMPAAIRLYSIAVVPDPSCRNMMAFAHLRDEETVQASLLSLFQKDHS
jgi:hypothetical protein